MINEVQPNHEGGWDCFSGFLDDASVLSLLAPGFDMVVVLASLQVPGPANSPTLLSSPPLISCSLSSPRLSLYFNLDLHILPCGPAPRGLLCALPTPLTSSRFSFLLSFSYLHSYLARHRCRGASKIIMASSSNPSSIPPITALRQELDYGDPQLARCQAFYDSVRLFRKTFVSSQGWDGPSIHDWRSKDHQIALGEMVRSYLEQHKNGIFFWPDDKSQSRANRFQYSTDSVR